MEKQSRMDKYFDAMDEEVDTNTGEIHVVSSRLQKNQELYREVGSLDIDDFDLNSNVSILGDNTANIDLNVIQEKLNMKYHEDRKDKGLGVDDENPLPKINLDETREYDINNILAKAKEEKEIDYEEDRLKKLRNTQYDILKNLDIEGKEEEVVEKKTNRIKPNSEDEKKLLDLIDTITAKELIKKEQEDDGIFEGDLDPLDILSDLKGDDDNTRVMGAIAFDENGELTDTSMKPLDIDNTEELESTDEIDEVSDDTEELNEDTETNILDDTDTDILDDTDTDVLDKADTDMLDDTDTDVLDDTDIDVLDKKDELDDTDANLITKENSFITSDTSPFNTKDFDDFKDIRDDMRSSKFFVRLMIALLVIVFIIGIVILLNNYLNLGLF